jgi:hypothetical protein
MTHGELAVILEGRGRRVRPRHGGRGFMAQCPSHGDGRHLSLAVSVGNDGWQLMHCFAGCDFEDVRQSLGLPISAFFGWDAYNHKRLRSTSPARSLTLSITAVRVLNAKKLLALQRTGRLQARAVGLLSPPSAGPVTRAVAADMANLFGLADSAGVGDFPLMYGSGWAAGRLGVSGEGVRYALRRLVAHGWIVRAEGVPSWHGRSTRTYRRAGR